MISVILCGGAGSRLWPISREAHPKPFLKLPDGRSFMEKALLRGAGVPGVRRIMTVTNAELSFKIASELENANITVESCHILEPFGRNTGPAIAAAALAVERHFGGETMMLVLPADHVIASQDRFVEAVAEARRLAARERLVVFGIQPAAPATGFGYIQADGGTVKRFVEKPDRQTAERFVNSGDFYWNSGMFCFTAATMLSECARHAPGLLAAVERCLPAGGFQARKGMDDLPCLELDPTAFAAVPGISIDYAIMEKSDRVSMVPCDIGWSDVGSWSALSELNPVDGVGNRLMGDGDVRLHDTVDCVVRADKRLVAMLGVKNLLVVDTPDAVLVADKSAAGRVNEVYSRLREENHAAYRQHTTVFRPWGSYTLLEVGPRFKIKRLTIKPGASISLQLHRHRHEHWVVVSGMAEVTCDDQVFFLDSNESTYIKAGRRHRVANRGMIDLSIIEVQSGDYLGDDDVVRFDDEYGRV